MFSVKNYVIQELKNNKKIDMDERINDLHILQIQTAEGGHLYQCSHYQHLA